MRTTISLRHIAGHVISAADINGQLDSYKLRQKQTFLFRDSRKGRRRSDAQPFFLTSIAGT